MHERCQAVIHAQCIVIIIGDPCIRNLFSGHDSPFDTRHRNQLMSCVINRLISWCLRHQVCREKGIRGEVDVVGLYIDTYARPDYSCKPAGRKLTSVCLRRRIPIELYINRALVSS